MTASKISQIAAILKASELMETQNKPQGTDVAFGTLLSQTPGGGNQSQDSMAQGLKDAVKPAGASHTAYEKGVAQLGYRENSVSQKENPAAQNELPEDTPEKLKEFGEKVTEAVAEELGVTEEEVVKQMEAMGLTVLDLMDPSKLAGLVLGLTGSEDVGGLLLSGGFQQLLGEIGELAQDFLAGLGLTPQDLPQVMEQLEALLPEGLGNQEMDAAGKEADIIVGQLQEPADPKEPMGFPESSIKAQQPGEGPEILQAAEQGQEPALQEPAEEGANATQQAASLEEGQPEEEMQQSYEEGQEGGAAQKEFANEAEKAKPQQGQVTYQTTAQTVNQGQAVEFTQTITQAKVDVEGIMRQISQMTRIVVSKAETSIEMQLNPENLGKVYLQVVSRQGAITAQLAAQDEAVKQALESQIAILKENMNQQGLKVEAVEVTIASHEFERNLEENQKNPSQEQQEAEMGRQARRNINLNSLDDLEGLMSEEESLVARMMSDQGNSVDLTA